MQCILGILPPEVCAVTILSQSWRVGGPYTKHKNVALCGER